MKSVQEYLPSRFWLMKSEPDVFSFQDLLDKPSQREKWDGVRNYLARNFMQKEMKVGDQVLFYHSNASPSGIAGLCEVVELATPDETAFDKNSLYYDPKSQVQNPRWFAVSVGKPKKIKNFLSLAELKTEKKLQEMLLLRKGQRLSILPISREEWNWIVQMANSAQ